MKKKLIVKILKVTGAVTAVLAIVLCVHIYQVTRPPVANENTISMARIDFKQDLTKADSVKITSWLYNQKGVDHVFCNTESRTAVFSFYPVKTDATEVAKLLAMNLDYKAERFMPSAEAMKGGCPVK
jgi:uncharacterized protein YpmB